MGAKGAAKRSQRALVLVRRLMTECIGDHIHDWRRPRVLCQWLVGRSCHMRGLIKNRFESSHCDINQYQNCTWNSTEYAEIGSFCYLPNFRSAGGKPTIQEGSESGFDGSLAHHPNHPSGRGETAETSTKCNAKKGGDCNKVQIIFLQVQSHL